MLELNRWKNRNNRLYHCKNKNKTNKNKKLNKYQHKQKNSSYFYNLISSPMETLKLTLLLEKLEKHNIFLYDTGKILYFMHIPTEKKSRFFRSDTKNLNKILVDFCENLLNKLEN